MRDWKIKIGPVWLHRAEAEFYEGIETRYEPWLIVSADNRELLFSALINLKTQLEAAIREEENARRMEVE